MGAQKCYQAHPVVLCGDEQNGAILYNPDTDNTVVVNRSGRLLWAYLNRPRTLDEIAAYLVQTYRGTTAEQATADAARFVKALRPGFVIELNAHG